MILPFADANGRDLLPLMRYAGAGVLSGLEGAVARGVAHGVYFNVTLRDSRCNNAYGPKSFTDSVRDGAQVIFGPSCDYALGEWILF